MHKSKCFLLFACVCLFAAGCSSDSELCTLKEWEVRPGSSVDPSDAAAGTWKPTRLPSYGRRIEGFEDYRGWLVLRSRLPAERCIQQKNQLAVDAGILSDVARVYVNDELVGELGSMEPYRTASMMTFLKTVPPAIQLKPGDNYLYLVLYTNGTYPIFATEYPVIGNSEAVFRQYYKNEIISIVLLGIYLLVGLYYLYLWSRRKKDLYHLYFGLLCVLLCSYWFFRLGSRDALFGNNVLLRSRFELVLLFLISPVFSFFLSQFFHRSYDKLGRIVLAFCLVLSAFTAFGPYVVASICLKIWQFCIMPIMMYYIFYIFRELYRRNKSALYLIPGVVTLMVGGIHDILAIRGWVSTPMIARFAFPIFILGGAMVLTRRFVLVHGQVEELLGNANRLENFRKELLSIDPGASINVLLERILVVLKTLFDCENAFAIVPDKFGALHFTQELPEEIQRFTLRGNRLYRRTTFSREFFAKYGSVLQLSAQKLQASSDAGRMHVVSLKATEVIFQKVGQLGYKIAIALPHESEILGMIFLGEKYDKKEYSEAELSLMKTFQYSITQAIRNKLLFSEVSQLKGEAEQRVEKLSEYVIERSNSFKLEVDEKIFVYSSRSMIDVYGHAKKYAEANKPVLITGETGTGKELIARAVHHFRNPDSPFLAANCAAIPESLWESEVFGHAKGAFTSADGTHTGLIERAKNGTLFFDEIGEMPLSVQPKMLRLLQERKFVKVGGEREIDASCQFLFATNRSLLEMQKEGKFREDLYYRISVFQITLPPLRDRRAEIPALVRLFVEKYSRELRGRDTTVGPAAMSALCRYSWPGNVRELENCIIQGIVHSKDDELQLEDLPPGIRGFSSARATVDGALAFDYESPDPFEKMIADYSRKLLLSALSKTKGNKVDAAKMLGLKRTTLYNKLKELGLR